MAAELPDDDFPLLPYAATSGWSGTDTSRERAERRDADGSTEGLQRRLHELIAETRFDGLTVAEARRALWPEHHGSISGALSNLHMKGLVALLAERRENCHIYVLPEYVDGRKTITQGRGMPNANRNRGDYLERQTKAALAEHGWVCVRAAGSLGPADVVAMRSSGATLLIACKTNGKIPPAERVALIAAAEQAGARPVLAHRERRGWISFGLVHVDGVQPWASPIRVPKRGAQVDGDDGDGDDGDA